jgi:hypothetical protein
MAKPGSPQAIPSIDEGRVVLATAACLERVTNPSPANALNISHADAGSGTGAILMEVTAPKICCASVQLLNCM